MDGSLLSAGEYIEREPKDQDTGLRQHAEELLFNQEGWPSRPFRRR